MRPAASLIALVREIVDEPVAGLSDASILASLNEALGIVAEKLTPPTLVIAFEPVDIYAGESVIDLGALNYDMSPGKIVSVHSFEKRKVKIHKRVADAEADFSKSLRPSKSPSAVLVSGNSAILIPEASEDTVVYLSYIRKPDLYASVDDDGGDIVFLPDVLGEKFLVNYAASLAYRKIEDGVTDGNENFKIYYELAMTALGSLRDFFGPEANQARPETVSGANEVVGPYQIADLFL